MPEIIIFIAGCVVTLISGGVTVLLLIAAADETRE
jgi:hypothetical protein